MAEMSMSRNTYADLVREDTHLKLVRSVNVWIVDEVREMGLCLNEHLLIHSDLIKMSNGMISRKSPRYRHCFVSICESIVLCILLEI